MRIRLRLNWNPINRKVNRQWRTVYIMQSNFNANFTEIHFSIYIMTTILPPPTWIFQWLKMWVENVQCPSKKNVDTSTTESVSNFVFACVKVKLGNIFDGCYFKVSGRRYSMAYIKVCVFLFLFCQLKSHYHSLSVVACCFYWFVRSALLSIPFACWFSGLNFVNSIRILIVTSICHASNFLCFFIDCGDSIKFWLNFDNGVNEHEKIIDQTFSPRLPSENKFN